MELIAFSLASLQLTLLFQLLILFFLQSLCSLPQIFLLLIQQLVTSQIFYPLYSNLALWEIHLYRPFLI